MAHISEFLGNPPANDHFALRLWDTMMAQPNVQHAHDSISSRLAAAGRESLVWAEETETVFVCRGTDGTIGVELGPAGVRPESGPFHVMIRKIHPGSRAAEEGVLKVGDIIVGVDGIEVGEDTTFFEVMADLPPKKPYYEWVVRRSTAVETPRVPEQIEQPKPIASPREPCALTQELNLNLKMIRLPQMKRRSSSGIAKQRRSIGSNGTVGMTERTPAGATCGPSASEWDWVRPAAPLSTPDMAGLPPLAPHGLGRSAAEINLNGRPRADSEKVQTRPRVPSTGGLSSLLPMPVTAR